MAKSTASHSQPWQSFRLKFAQKFCPYCGKVYFIPSLSSCPDQSLLKMSAHVLILWQSLLPPHFQRWQWCRLKFALCCPYCGKVYSLRTLPALAIVQIKVCSKCLPMCPYCGKVYNTPSTLPQRWQWSRLIFCGFISCLFQTLNTSTLPLAQSQYCVYTVYNGCILQLRIIIQYKGWIYNYIFLKKVFINSFVFDLGRDNICNCTHCPKNKLSLEQMRVRCVWLVCKLKPNTLYQCICSSRDRIVYMQR